MLYAWLGIQLAALAMAAFRVRLSIAMPAAAEQSALALMLITQVAAASLLFPLLLRSRLHTILTIATAWPMGLLACFLTDAPVDRFIAAQALVTLWIVVLALWNWAVPRAQALGAAVAAMISLGGPLLWYLRAEFVRESAHVHWPRDALLGPVMAALSQISPDHPQTNAWWPLLGLAALAVMVSALTKLLHRAAPGLISPRTEE